MQFVALGWDIVLICVVVKESDRLQSFDSDIDHMVEPARLPAED